MIRKLIGPAFMYFLLLVLASVNFAQTPETSAKPSLVTGDVSSIETGKIILKTKDGSLNIALSDKTAFKRVPADNPNPSAAVAAAFSDIGVGDKLAVSGFLETIKVLFRRVRFT